MADKDTDSKEEQQKAMAKAYELEAARYAAAVKANPNQTRVIAPFN